MTNRRKPSWWVAALALSFVLNGCAFFISMESSNPVAEPETDVTLDGKGILHLPDLDLKAIVHNAHIRFVLVGIIVPIIPLPGALFSDEAPPFTIDLILDPAGEDLAFDPGLVALRVAEGPAIPPDAFKQGPGTFQANIERESCLDPSSASDSAARNLPVAVPVPVMEQTCFRLLFNRPVPSPKTPLVLSINGITMAGQPFFSHRSTLKRHGRKFYGFTKIEAQPFFGNHWHSCVERMCHEPRPY